MVHGWQTRDSTCWTKTLLPTSFAPFPTTYVTDGSSRQPRPDGYDTGWVAPTLIRASFPAQMSSVTKTRCNRNGACGCSREAPGLARVGSSNFPYGSPDPTVWRDGRLGRTAASWSLPSVAKSRHRLTLLFLPDGLRDHCLHAP